MNISFSPKKHKSFPFLYCSSFVSLVMRQRLAIVIFPILTLKARFYLFCKFGKKKHFSKALVHREALFAVKICPCLSF